MTSNELERSRVNKHLNRLSGDDGAERGSIKICAKGAKISEVLYKIQATKRGIGRGQEFFFTFEKYSPPPPPDYSLRDKNCTLQYQIKS